jgi:nitrogenase subunit NifH
MKTYKQWCEQTQNVQQDDLANSLSQITQKAIQQGKDPKEDIKKILTQKTQQATAVGDSNKVAKIANVASKLNVDSHIKLKMKK